MMTDAAGSSTTTMARVKLVIAEVCSIVPERVQPEAFLLAYDIDSLRSVDLFLAIEDAFGVQAPEHDPRLQDVRTVRDLAAYVDLLCAESST